MATLSFKENALLVLRHQEPEYLPMITDLQTYTPLGMDFVCEYTNVPGEAPDWFGQNWTFEPSIGASNPTPGKHLVPDITRWRDYMKFPDLSRLDWEGHSAKDMADWDREHRLTRINDVFGPWERMFSVMEFQEALCALMEEPEACYDFFGAVADHKIRMYEYIVNYYHPDVICMHDDYGHGKGMFMSPDVWRRLLKPHLQRIIDMVTSHGIIYEHHCCGYFAPIMEEIADMGCAATNLVHISNHPAELKKEIPMGQQSRQPSGRGRTDQAGIPEPYPLVGMPARHPLPKMVNTHPDTPDELIRYFSDDRHYSTCGEKAAL